MRTIKRQWVKILSILFYFAHRSNVWASKEKTYVLVKFPFVRTNSWTFNKYPTLHFRIVWNCFLFISGVPFILHLKWSGIKLNFHPAAPAFLEGRYSSANWARIHPISYGLNSNWTVANLKSLALNNRALYL